LTTACDSSDDDDYEEEKRPSLLVLRGPPGVGKTSAVHYLARQSGFSVLEVNCSSRRSGKVVLTQLREATQSHQLQQKGKSDATANGCAILLDDVNVVFEGEDDGFVSAVGVFAAETKRPIILTTTSPNFTGFDGNFGELFDFSLIHSDNFWLWI
jgi:DNA polymerase III delta prime subunit